LAIYLTSVAAGLAAAILQRFVASACLIAPAVLQSALVLLGHVVTLDDECPGEWSNPDRSLAIWRESLRDVAVKFTAFAVALAILVFTIAQL
jgi:hypothetical protein